MLFKREGYPEEDELVLCTVTKVHTNGVFCNLDEYNDSGMIHISEVSPGRIRNLRNFVKEGKKVVCLILKVNRERGHIDLSLRRVNENQKRCKLESIKQEQKAEKIIEILATELKKPFPEIYKKVSVPILKEYDMVHPAFHEVVEHDLDLSKLGLDKKIAEKLMVIVKDKIKPKEVTIQGVFSIAVYTENGVEVVKEALVSGSKDNNVDVKYEGGGRYLIRITAKEYKEAEEKLKESKSIILDFIEKNDGIASFERIDK